jgi:hypothetical protein
MKIENLNLALLIVIIALLAYKFLYRENTGDFKVQNETIIARDTITSVIENKPMIIKQKKMKVIETKLDTMIYTNPFKIELDTAIDHDTVKLSYSYPANLLDLEIRKRPDSSFKEKIYLALPKSNDKAQWWEKPLLIAGSAVFGYLIGSVK